MKSRRFRHKSYSRYLCTLAVFDSLVLVAKLLDRVDGFLRYTDRPSLYANYGDAGCKVYQFVEHVCYLMSSWLVLCMTLERFIAVTWPLRKDNLCKPRYAVSVTLVVFAVMSYSQTFRLIVLEQDENGDCVAPRRYQAVYVALHIYLYQLVLQFMLPALLILVCNLVILYKIRRLRFRFAERSLGRCYHAQQLPAGHTHARRNKTTCMLLIVSFSYVGALLPLVLLSLAIHVAMHVNTDLARQMFEKLNDVRQLLELVSELNYGINFYIYVLSGAQFRYELRHICTRAHPFTSSPAPTERVFHFNRKSRNTSNMYDGGRPVDVT
ncbi:hypothetical protein LSH36_123g01005 [Paralvinella palmiformis]|uniref:G-protein coupled receptors family 1 profile domain-containing protein n=1 Tax=Paralvinella palmiformis TaxID=53620 RepID=A0AAD9NA16_9ANNE|nr:hypothetical protein LSH36_123g01005 [Paralvinella palmiformis]